MIENQNKKEPFYTQKTALELEYSKNGLFVTIAPAKGKNDNDNMTFDWEKKVTVKMSVSEVSALADAADIFRREGPDAFTKYCQTFFGKDSYKNMVFVHDPSKRDVKAKSEGFTKTGLMGGRVLNFLIEKRGTKQTHPIFFADLGKFVRFMNYMVNMSFHSKGY